MTDAELSLAILAVVVALFIWNRLPVEVVALGTGLALYGTGLLTVEQTVSGFGDPVVIFIAALFVVSEGLNVSGITTWVGQQVIERAGTHPPRLLLVVMGMCALLTALISLNGAVAALLPVTVALAMRAKVAPSRMLMPLAFAGSAGSMLVLTGTPINVIVSDAAVAAGGEAFGFFEFGLVGVPLLAGTMAITALLGPRLLPVRQPPAQTADLSGYARTLVETYALDDDLYHLRLRSGSPFVGRARIEVETGEFPGLSFIPERVGSDTQGVGPLAEGDVLIVRGDADAVNRLALSHTLTFVANPDEVHVADTLIGQDFGVAEVVLPPRSRLIGEPAQVGMVRGGTQVLLAIRRLGKVRQGPVTLEVGDTLLLQGPWDALEQTAAHPDVLVVDSPELVRRQLAPLDARALKATIVLLGMVAMMALNVTPAVIAALIAAVAMLLLGVLQVEQAYRAIPWTTIVLVGGLIPMSIAISQSGAADLIADVLVSVVGDGGPYALMAAIFVITAVLGQIISNTATALIILPVAIAAASELEISPQPVLMLLTVAAAAALLTPISTAANMMVMGPGGYRFGDYWKLGLPIMAWFAVVAIGLVPLIWTF